MGHRKSWVRLICMLVAVTMLGADLLAQEYHVTVRRFASNIVVPQRRAFAIDRRAGQIEITEVEVGVVILEQAATTTMDISLKNSTSRRQEAELVVPVPDGAVVRAFTFQGAGSEPTATVLPKPEARKTYDAIVAKIRDPALLEFIGYNLIRSSIFPIPPQGTQKVRLTYERLLPADGNRIDYVLPRSESLDYKVPWKVAVKIKSKKPISTVYSPTHKLVTRRSSHNQVAVRIADDATTEPGPFRLSYLLEQDGISASMFAYPDPKVGGGYFLLLTGLPASLPRRGGVPAIKREVTLVFDCSGSMQGEKIKQVREAALQILAGLEEGEAFNIIAYNEAVDFFSREPVLKTEESVNSARAYLATIKARGGTNIHDALVEALRQKPMKGMLPIVLFLTDGLPTIGQTSEVAIRNVAIEGNPHSRRIFTFGVGVDVNAPLLEKIATETRATPTFVLPGEDVEVKVAQVFKKLYGPVLAEPEIQMLDAAGKAAPRRARELIPARLPDLFEGDQLVLLGKYLGEEPLRFKLSGNYLGKKRSFRFKFSLDKAATRNAFVPRLWASRKIALLVDAIRQSGADSGLATANRETRLDPEMKELVQEIVRLSTEFGILTEYTAFLAREGTDLSRRDRVLAQAESNFIVRGINTRTGLGALNQAINNGFQMRQVALNRYNGYFDEKMNRVAIAEVQQINDLAFYQRGNRWVDSRIVTRESEIEPKKVIEFGSEEFRKLVYRLAEEGRQGSISLRGDILLVVDGEPVLVKGPVGK